MNTTNKILIGLILIAAIVGGYFYFKSPNTPAPANEQTNNPTNPNPEPMTPTPSPSPSTETPAAETSVAVFETSKGSFEVTLDAKTAPKTVANFVKLANEGYYNGVKFHRIIKSFMIQSGDPNSKDNDPANDGFGGPGYTVPAEISLKANQGAIGMASTAAKGPSSGSQFFVVTEESENSHLALDGNYTFFGYVTSGMDVVTKIAATPTENNPYSGERLSFPKESVVINKITIK